MSIVDLTLTHSGGDVGVLLIHGLGGTPVELRSLARRLAGQGFTVHCPTLAGHCKGEAELAASTWQSWEASAEEGLDRLRRVCSTVIVGGLSLGGVIAARLAARRPDDVAGVVMLAPTIWLDGWSVPPYAFLLRWFINWPGVSRWSFAEREPYGLKDERARALVLNAMMSGASAEAGVFRTPAAALRSMWSLIREAKRDFPRVRQPVLIVHPREDDIASLRNVSYLQRRLGGLVDTLILDDSYHLITVDQQRFLVADRVAAFLHRLTPAGAVLRNVGARER